MSATSLSTTASAYSAGLRILPCPAKTNTVAQLQGITVFLTRSWLCSGCSNTLPHSEVMLIM
jgi:hypothetical protein